MWTDTHAHLDFYGSSGHVAEVVERAKQAGVGRIISVGDTIESCRKAVKMAEKIPDVYAAVGIHPHAADRVRPATIAELRKLAESPRVVAIGEIGLDYYRDRSPHSQQHQSFRDQLQLAAEIGKPVIVHNRMANQEVVETLEAEGFSFDRVLFHCFSGDRVFAREMAGRGCIISLAGPVTFSNPHDLPNVAKEVPVGSLVLETDSPFLAPHPHRGQTNEPSLLPRIGHTVARLRDIDSGELAEQTSANAARFFGLNSLASAG